MVIEFVFKLEFFATHCITHNYHVLIAKKLKINKLAVCNEIRILIGGFQEL